MHQINAMANVTTISRCQAKDKVNILEGLNSKQR